MPETITGSETMDTTGLKTIINALSADWSGKASSRNFSPPAQVMTEMGLNQAKIEARYPGQWSSIESQLGVAYSNSDHLPVYLRANYLIQEFTRLLGWGYQLMQEWDALGVPVGYGVINTAPVTGTGNPEAPSVTPGGGGGAVPVADKNDWLKWVLLAGAMLS